MCFKYSLQHLITGKGKQILLWFITSQKIKLSLEDYFNKYDQIRGFSQILSHLLKKFLRKTYGKHFL